MHMADALLSQAVGGTMWAATAALIGYSAKKVQKTLDDQTIPLMGVLGAFIFAAQMINFTIPATGSSGHLGGGMILAILLGPYAAFLTMASVLTIQALFFADGGLLALGCNIFNLGFFPCFLVYPLIYQKNCRAQSDSRTNCHGKHCISDYWTAVRRVWGGARNDVFGNFRASIYAICAAYAADSSSVGSNNVNRERGRMFATIKTFCLSRT